ncbi:MAG: hypothetical protein N2053_09030, partial [Chitinispirillaceae bacterium]|nr:hypothetical protein [Chitinispirillaceae bacterium]
YGRGQNYSSFSLLDRKGYVISAPPPPAIYRREMLDRIGGFDENFFAYCEDSDLSMRAFLSGWRCLYLPSAVVYHRGSESFSKVPEKIIYYGHRNRYLLIYKYFPLSIILLHLPWIMNSEMKIINEVCIRQKSLKKYMSIIKSIFIEYKKYKNIRKKNLKLLTQRRREFLFLLKNKIKVI